MTDRELFLCAVLTQQELTAEVVVLLAGEDATARAEVACDLVQRGAAPTLLITGMAETIGPHTSAHDTSVLVMTRGLAPAHITVDAKAPHTRAQSVNVIREAKAKGWQRLLLVASAYHLPRAFLTFLAAAREEGIADTLRLVPCAVVHRPWHGSPERMKVSRLGLLAREMDKIDTYGGFAHCASYKDGLAYLKAWEGR